MDLKYIDDGLRLKWGIENGTPLSNSSVRCLATTLTEMRNPGTGLFFMCHLPLLFSVLFSQLYSL